LKQQDDTILHQQQSSQPRRLTYRERRELELRWEREEPAEAEAAARGKKSEAESRDVASLIRRRVAANRHASNMPIFLKKTDIKTPVSYRDKLRPQLHQKWAPRWATSCRRMVQMMRTLDTNRCARRHLKKVVWTIHSNNRLHDDNKEPSLFQTSRRSSLD
jgi:hypothetical protein